jgi:hypothetical protein
LSNDEEINMRLLGKTAILISMACAMALGSMTASQARWRAGPAAAVGFVAGAAIGAGAANAGYYSGTGYGYDSYAYAPRYDSYAYEPGYVAPAYTSPTYYGPVNSPSALSSGYRNGYDYGSNTYDSNNTGPWRERILEGRDY